MRYKMSPVKAKICSKSDQNRVGDTTCKTVEKRTILELSAGDPPTPPPHLDVMADPAHPPHPPRGDDKTGTLRMRFGKKIIMIILFL